eukprot:TRINITY_DN27494_c0_g1_i1.p1 TRINITY_DN27494_c0_g1~~TRINITY_DN27494_c0_g1_i1.p1  ORF type:complete len:125 (+),score=63.21 TRINITY_DN27494_c0_g1_i1:40-375(+)
MLRAGRLLRPALRALGRPQLRWQSEPARDDGMGWAKAAGMVAADSDEARERRRVMEENRYVPMMGCSALFLLFYILLADWAENVCWVLYEKLEYRWYLQDIERRRAELQKG